MKLHPILIRALAAALLAGAGGGAGYWFAQRHAPTPTPAAGDGRAVLYWYDPMMPDQHFDRPGKSPFMDMQLVPRYAEEAGAANGVRIDPRLTQNLGLRLATVERGSLAAPVTAAATLMWNERHSAVVQARSAGFVERVYARAPGDLIGQGAPLADLLIPEWAAAQNEFLALRRSGERALADAARERMRLLGMPASLIGQIEASGQPRPVVTVTAPLAGVIQSLDVRAGMTLAAGAALARINGTDPVWLEAAVPQALAGPLAPGQAASATLPDRPELRLAGKIIAVLPEANADSRTVRVRVELPNRDGRLRPGLFAQLILSPPAAAPALLVPEEAVIRSGTRNLVLLAQDGGRYVPAEVRLGQSSGGKTEILEGVSAGQSVVASGQFLIDSEASLKGVLARLATTTTPAATSAAASAATPASAPAALHSAEGKIVALQDSELTLAHGPVASLGWPAMTMPFQLARPELAAGLKPGQRVRFAFHQVGDDYRIEQIEAAGSRP